MSHDNWLHTALAERRGLLSVVSSRSDRLLRRGAGGHLLLLVRLLG